MEARGDKSVQRLPQEFGLGPPKESLDLVI
jgi:hypothetical protein